MMSLLSLYCFILGFTFFLHLAYFDLLNLCKKNKDQLYGHCKKNQGYLRKLNMAVFRNTFNQFKVFSNILKLLISAVTFKIDHFVSYYIYFTYI